MTPKPRGTPPDRFWAKVDSSGDCWLWTASVNRRGYGYFGLRKGKTVRAHRWAWEQGNGPIPEGLFVCHACNTPRCVRPSHLFLGTNAENMAHAVATGLAKTYKPGGRPRNLTHCSRGHALEGRNKRVYRAPETKAGVTIACRTCLNGYARRKRLYAKYVGKRV